jgi:hypothetical protein
MRVAVLGLALTIAALPRCAYAQDDPACAKYEEPLAYNACLASHGPRANGLGASPEPGHAAAVRSGQDWSPSTVDRLPPGATRRRGRVHMEFRVQ